MELECRSPSAPPRRRLPRDNRPYSDRQGWFDQAKWPFGAAQGGDGCGRAQCSGRTGHQSTRPCLPPRGCDGLSSSGSF